MAINKTWYEVITYTPNNNSGTYVKHKTENKDVAINMFNYFSKRAIYGFVELVEWTAYTEDNPSRVVLNDVIR